MKHHFTSCLPVALCLTLAVAISGCSKDPTSSKGSNYDGTWKGTSSLGKEISITITNNTITEVSIGFKIRGDICTVEGNRNTALSQKITGNRFTLTNTESGSSAVSYTMTGAFGSNNSVSGNIEFTFAIAAFPNPTCTGSASATWNATK